MIVCPACREVRPHTRREWQTYHPDLDPPGETDPEVLARAARVRAERAAKEAARILKEHQS